MSLFDLGHVVATPGALEALKASDEGPFKYLKRHVNGDWGDVSKADAKHI